MIKNLKKRLKNQRGLTLVELLAVIVILGIVSAIAIPSIGGIIQKSKEDALKADAITILNAAKLHISSTNLTPDTGSTDSVTLLHTDLANYVESEAFEDVEYKVVYSISDKTYKLTTTKPAKITVGSSDIGFSNATLKDINDDKGKGSRTIPGTTKD